MTPSPTRNKKKTNEKIQKPEIFLQREIFTKLMEKGKSLKDIYNHLQVSSTGKVPTPRTLRNWKKKWENNQFTISDGRAGRVGVSPKVCARTASLFKKSGFDSIRKFSKAYGIPHSTVSRHLRRAGMHYCKSYRVPNVLTQDQKDKKVEIARKLKGELENSRREEFRNIITLDETPLYFENTSINVWKCVGDLYPRVEKASLKKKKMTLTIAWGGQGVVLVDGCKGENRINSDYFCNTVLSSIQQWARKRRPMTGVSSFLIHMDNAPCHNSRSTKEYLRQYNFNRLEHPPYSPDLAPCDFHLFGWMKSHFANTKFKSIRDAENQISNWVNSIPKETLISTFNNWIKRLDRCIEIGGDYVDIPNNKLYVQDNG